jgi:hypothetical protein
MVISYSVSNSVNYDLVGIGVENPALVFPAIYGIPGFGYTVTFTDLLYEIINVSVASSPINHIYLSYAKKQIDTSKMKLPDFKPKYDKLTIEDIED